MSLIGASIQNLLKLKAVVGIQKTPIESQKKQLSELLTQAKNTSFGQYYGFEELLNRDDILDEFRQRIPLYEYQKMDQEWWSHQRKYPNITWPGSPQYYALSSGTTGSSSKRIPATSEFLNSMRSVSLDQLSELSLMDLPQEVFESEALAISSSANLKFKNGHLEGEISGINVSNLPDWYDLFFRPGKEIASIDDWDHRTDLIAEKAPEWNIGVLSGIPSWVQLCLQKILKKNNAKYIDDIWPNVAVYLSGGVAFSTYKESFHSLFNKKITVVDTFLASEGYFAYGSADSPMEMKLAIEHGYFFEFIPFHTDNLNAQGKIKEDAKSLLIDQVKMNEDYALVISSCAGAWRYIIGDVIQFTHLDPPRIKITGRVKFFMNVVGSQLSEEKMNAAVSHLGQELSQDINAFMLTCKSINDEYHHVWTLVCDDTLDCQKCSVVLDEFLKGVNKNYKVARGKALKGVIVRTMTNEEYNAFLDGKKKLGGQVKIPKVMDEKGNTELETYMEENNIDSMNKDQSSG